MLGVNSGLLNELSFKRLKYRRQLSLSIRDASRNSSCSTIALPLYACACRALTEADVRRAGQVGRSGGCPRLHRRLRTPTLDEMEDAEKLIAHIVYLDGLPNVQGLNEVKIG